MKILIIDFAQFKKEILKGVKNTVFVESSAADTHIFKYNELITDREILNFNDYLILDEIDYSIFDLHYRDFHYNSLRYMLDYQIISDYYVKSIAFWFNYFKNNKVSYLFSLHTFNASPTHMSIIVAKKLNIPCFEGINILNPFNESIEYTFFDYLGNNFIENISKINTDSPVYNHKVDGLNLKTRLKSSLANFFLSNIIIFDIYNILRSRNKNSIIYYNFNFYRDFTDYLNYKLKKYKSSPNKSINLDNLKFVFFALHLEPEAALTGKTSIHSQFSWINIISEFLPENIYIVVKAHPITIKSNNLRHSYLIRNSNYYNSKDFYNNLNRNRKVIFIDPRRSSKEIITKSILTISLRGSVLGEAILYEKPALILERKHSIIRYIKEVYKFNGMKDLKKMLLNIEKIPNVVKYSSAPAVYRKFSFNPNSQIEDIKNSIESHIKKQNA